MLVRLSRLTTARPAKAPGMPTMPSKAIQPGRPLARNIRYKPQAQSTKPAQAKSCVAPLPGRRPGCRVPTMPMLAKPCGISASSPRTTRANPDLYTGVSPISDDTGLNPRASKEQFPAFAGSGHSEFFAREGGGLLFEALPFRAGFTFTYPTAPHSRPRSALRRSRRKPADDRAGCGLI